MNAKRLSIVLLFLLGFFVLVVATHASSSDEVSLFDFKGRAIAYIAEDWTIYLWDGKPVAYLDGQTNGLDIYGFNGRHPGWFKGAILYDHEGYVVGGVREVFKTPPKLEPIKPLFSDQWAELPLKFFLNGGGDSAAAKGVVFRRPSGCDYFVVATKSGYDVLEWFGGHDPDKDDQLMGGFESYGFHDIYDETADEELRIWTEDYWLSKEDALEKLTDKCA